MSKINSLQKLLPLSALLIVLACSQEYKPNIGKLDHCPEQDQLTEPDTLPEPSLELSLTELGDFQGSSGYVVAKGQELVFDVFDIVADGPPLGWLFYYNRETEIIREIFSPNHGHLAPSAPFKFVDNYLTFVTREIAEVDSRIVPQWNVYLYNIAEDILAKISQNPLASDSNPLLLGNFLFYQSSSLVEKCNQDAQEKQPLDCKNTVIYNIRDGTRTSLQAPLGSIFSVFKGKVGYLSKEHQMASIQDIVTGEIENYPLPQTVLDRFSDEIDSGTDLFSFQFPYVFFDRQSTPNSDNQASTYEEIIFNNDYDLFRYDLSFRVLREFTQGAFTMGNHPVQKDDTIVFNGFRRDRCDWQDLNDFSGHRFGYPYSYNINNDTFQQLHFSPQFNEITPQTSISDDKIAFSVVVGDETKIIVIDKEEVNR